MPISTIRRFFQLEASAGIILVLASALAIAIANSPIAHWYGALLGTRMQISVGEVGIAKPIVLWINDGLMAVFFLLVGLEIKRELKEGELSSRAQAILPLIAAVGGMAVPAGIYAFVNLDHPANMNGWAIPSATDIAFSLGVLSLLGSRVPLSLKVLLTAIAIFDDLGAIVVIAIFYTADLSVLALALASIALVLLLVLNLSGVRYTSAYVVVGAFLWVCVLESGVHATLSGVALAAAIPLRPGADGRSMLKSLEHGLHPWVTFGVLPVFGFANAGVSFAGMGLGDVLHPITLGIALGLFAGKQVGIFGSIWLACRLGLARRPDRATWLQVYGMAVLCGIGFTMSLFIGSLAWPHTDNDPEVRLGVLVGSLAAAVLGFLLLRASAMPAAEVAPPAHAGPATRPAPSAHSR